MVRLLYLNIVILAGKFLASVSNCSVVHRTVKDTRHQGHQDTRWTDDVFKCWTDSKKWSDASV